MTQKKNEKKRRLSAVRSSELLGCHFCGGTSGVEAKYIEIRTGLWLWGIGLQLGEFENSRIPKTGKCIDCGKRVTLPIEEDNK